jgi:arginase
MEIAGLKVAKTITVDEPQHVDEGQPSLRHLNAVAAVCTNVHLAVAECHRQRMFPVCLGGDHSLAVGSVAATAAMLSERGHRLGLLWVDAHIDMNTAETTPSGNIHGMAMAALCGLGHPSLVNVGYEGAKVQREHIMALGLRLADRSELRNLRDEGPRVISVRDLDGTSIEAALRDWLPVILADTGGFHLSLDLDALDPAYAPGVNTPFPGGMTFREVRTICDKVAATGRLVSMDLVEHNPDMGRDDVMLPIISELIACALGASAMP